MPCAFTLIALEDLGKSLSALNFTVFGLGDSRSASSSSFYILYMVVMGSKEAANLFLIIFLAWDGVEYRDVVTGRCSGDSVVIARCSMNCLLRLELKAT